MASAPKRKAEEYRDKKGVTTTPGTVIWSFALVFNGRGRWGERNGENPKAKSRGEKKAGWGKRKRLLIRS